VTADGPDLLLEKAHAMHGLVCGVDEAGRGPWAGPVSAGAVILDPQRIPAGLNDSKKLSHARRCELEIEIKASALAWGVGFANVAEIADLNILQATGLAMCRAIEALKPAPAFALVDGSYKFKLPCPIQTVVGGDGKSLSIAAASILAKVARDRLMEAMDETFPGYGFAKHKGYGAPAHIAALQSLGPCPEHRMTWAPIRLLLSGAASTESLGESNTLGIG
jgi:ribonuclease HII